MAEGLSNGEIAERLVLALSTVKWYVRQIYGKLGVRNRRQAFLAAQHLNLLGAGPGNAVPLDVPLPEWMVSDNPYKGLEAFQQSDAANFFGREVLIGQLVARLQDSAEFNHFLAVVGPSGSGKSSVVRAGLLPALAAGRVPGSERWFVVDMLPGAHPLDKLEVGLLRVAAHQGTNIGAHLRRNSGGLTRIADLILPADGSHLVIIVDQFEEVFTLVEDESERQNFLDLIHTAVTEPHSRVRVIVTLRADCYDCALGYPGMAELFQKRVESVLPLSAEELERAIVRPAERAGITFEKGLVARIVSEMTHQPGALPLLQYALTELFVRREGRTLTHVAYQQIGGAVGALAHRADEIYLDLNEDAQALARQMFMRLVTLSEGVEYTHRRTTQAELLSLTDNRDLMQDIIDQFAEYRLLSLGHDPESRQVTVELAHEAILREWDRLRDWLDEARDDIRQERALARAAEDWDAHDRDASYLLRGVRLQQIEAWQSETSLIQTPLEQQLIQISLAERAREHAAEQTRQAREQRLERRSRRLRRTMVAVLLAATVVASGLAAFALNERNHAVRSADLARSLQLAADSQLALNASENDLALLLALEAVKIHDPPLRAELVLSEVAYAPGTRWMTEIDGNVASISLSPDGRYAVLGLGRIFLDQPREEDNSLRLIDLQTGKQIRALVGHKDTVYAVDFSSDGRHIVSGSFDAVSGSPETALIVWDAATGEIVRRFHFEGGITEWVAFTPDNGHVISTHTAETTAVEASGTVVEHPTIVWNIESGEPVRRIAREFDNVHFVQISKDGRYVAVLLRGAPGRKPHEAEILLYDPLTGELIRTITAYGVLPDFGGMVISGNSRIMRVSLGGYQSLWDLESGEQIRAFPPSVTASASGGTVYYDISPDGSIVASGTWDGEIELRDLVSYQEIIAFRAHAGPIHFLHFTPDGRGLLSAAADGVRLWDLEPGALMQRYHPPEALPFIRFDNPLVLTANDISFANLVTVNGTLIHRDIASGEIIQQIRSAEDNEPLWGLDVMPDGSAALVAADSRAVLYDLTTGSEIRSFAYPATSEGGHVRISPDGRTALLTVWGPTTEGVILWDLETGEDLHHFETSSDATLLGNTATASAFSPDGNMAVVGRLDGTVISYELNTLRGHLRS